MTQTSPPAGWYPDPLVPGAQRYFDGRAWTAYAAPAPQAAYPAGLPPPAHSTAPAPWAPSAPSAPWAPWAPWAVTPIPVWKGARYGLPPAGPGALADPGRRLGARCIDWLVFVAVAVVLITLALSLTHAYAGPFLPQTPTRRQLHPVETGFFWEYLAVFLAVVTAGVLIVLYETVATARWGRTLGKACLHIRPVTTDGRPLGAGRSLARAAVQLPFALLFYVWLADALWCLSDQERQCLHTKIAGTVVVNDPVAPPRPTLDLRASATAPPRLLTPQPPRW